MPDAAGDAAAVERLAGFAGLPFDDLPDAVADRERWHRPDRLCCALYGSTTPWVGQVRAVDERDDVRELGALLAAQASHRYGAASAQGATSESTSSTTEPSAGSASSRSSDSSTWSAGSAAPAQRRYLA